MYKLHPEIVHALDIRGVSIDSTIDGVYGWVSATDECWGFSSAKAAAQDAIDRLPALI